MWDTSSHSWAVTCLQHQNSQLHDVHTCGSGSSCVHYFLLSSMFHIFSCTSCLPVLLREVLTSLQSTHLFVLWTSKIKCHPYLSLHLIRRGNKAHSAVYSVLPPFKVFEPKVKQLLLLPKHSLTSIDSSITDNGHTSPPSFGRRGKKPQSPEGRFVAKASASASASACIRTEKMTGLSTVSHPDSWETCCMCFLLTEGWHKLYTSCQQVCQCFTGKMFTFALIRILKHATSIRPWQRPRKHYHRL